MSFELLDDLESQMYETALEVAKAAGQMIRDAFKKEKTISMKESFADLVTETDQLVEKTVHDIIIGKFPSHKFIGEETVAETGAKCILTDDPTWIIDPVDGTTNFVHTVPEVAFSLGITVNKKVVIGVVYVPMKDEMFTARRGHGAFLNGERLQVNKVTDPKSCLLITEMGSSRDEAVLQKKMSNFTKVNTHCAGIRCYGSAAVNLCHVACGRGDAYFEYGIHVWDYCAGALIAEEAGATVTDTTGGPMQLFNRRVLAACTAELSSKITPLLDDIEMESD